jgi:cobalt-zinc-cadmium resistance protein CzcA
MTELEVAREVSVAWAICLQFPKAVLVYLQLDSIFKDFERAARLRFGTQATSRLEFLSAQARLNKSVSKKEKSKRDYQIALQKLNLWFVSDTFFTVEDNSLESDGLMNFSPTDTIAYQHPAVTTVEQKVQLADAKYKLQKTGYLPKFTAEYGCQKIGTNQAIILTS